MNTIILEEKYILEYIKNTINEIKTKSYIVNNAKYHHNTDYCNAQYICQYGILTLLDLKKTGIKNYSDDILNKMNDVESHVNGNDSVSLSVMGLQDLYIDEYEYDAFNPSKIDFLVSNKIKTGRYSTHYGNEYLSYSSITPNQLRSIDIRLLTLIDMPEAKKTSYNITTTKIIENYNYLKNIALAIKNNNLNIPLREMSDNNYKTIDIDKLSSIPKLILK